MKLERRKCRLSKECTIVSLIVKTKRHVPCNEEKLRLEEKQVCSESFDASL